MMMIPIYLQPFNAPVGGDPLVDLRDFWWVSCRIMAMLQYGAKMILYR